MIIADPLNDSPVDVGLIESNDPRGIKSSCALRWYHSYEEK